MTLTRSHQVICLAISNSCQFKSDMVKNLAKYVKLNSTKKIFGKKQYDQGKLLIYGQRGLLKELFPQNYSQEKYNLLS